MGSLGASRTHRVSLHYPETGSPRADVILEGGAVPSVGSRVTLTIADLSVTATVFRSGDDIADPGGASNARPHVVLVGGLGWEKALVSPPTYQDDNGVRLSTILRDLATRAGATIEQPTDVIIGDHWICPAARPGEYLRVRDVLAALYEQGIAPPWRVDPDGVTRFGLRTGGAVTARATVLRRDLGVGLRVVGLDAPSAFLPGGTIDGGAVIRKVIFNETSGALTADVWSDGRLTFASRVKRIVAEAFPALVYGYPRTYTVAAVGADGRLDLAPPSDAPHLRALEKVEQWTLGGAMMDPAVGSRVVVQFRDAMPSRPYVSGFPPSITAWPGARFVREGDIYSLGTASGALTFVSSLDPNGATKVRG